MAKDYGRRQTRRSSSAPKQFFLILASFLCGYLTATVFDFTSLSSWVNTNVLNGKNKTQPVVQQVKQQERELPKPKFEFYTLLAKDGGTTSMKTAAESHLANTTASQTKPASAAEVTTSTPLAAVAAAASAQKHASTQNIPNKPPVKGVYLIQLASFNRKADAEHLQASLILKGYDVHISTVQRGQVNWFRVNIGPFSTRADAEKAQTAVAQTERMKGMILRMNG